MQLADFDFDLPQELIAQHPLAERAASRLLVCRAAGLAPGLVDARMRALPELLAPGDLLVFNDTRVIKARLLGRKATGGRVEALIERPIDARRAWAQLRASKSPGPGSRLVFGAAGGVNDSGRDGAHDSAQDDVPEGAAGVGATVLGRDGGFFELAFDEDLDTLLERHGSLPLPPYITHAPDATDAERYQTVFARQPGAVAAPTAGLHFDAPLLAALAARGIATATLTLHVGAGTFQPVRSERLDEHVMQLERYVLSPELVAALAATRARGGRVVAVGTTSLRALESAAAAPGGLAAGPGETRLFITPGYRFRVVDALVTNFHLPRSTLLMLVSAFAGMERIRAAYAHAIAQRYRFFSYGDAMLLEPAPEALDPQRQPGQPGQPGPSIPSSAA